MKLEEEYFQATNWNLITLDELFTLSRSSKARIKRQKDICYKMLQVCDSIQHQIDMNSLVNIYAVSIIADAKKNPKGLKGALDRWMQGCFNRKKISNFQKLLKSKKFTKSLKNELKISEEEVETLKEEMSKG